MKSILLRISWIWLFLSLPVAASGATASGASGSADELISAVDAIKQTLPSGEVKYDIHFEYNFEQSIKSEMSKIKADISTDNGRKMEGQFKPHGPNFHVENRIDGQYCIGDVDLPDTEQYSRDRSFINGFVNIHQVKGSEFYSDLNSFIAVLVAKLQLATLGTSFNLTEKEPLTETSEVGPFDEIMSGHDTAIKNSIEVYEIFSKDLEKMIFAHQSLESGSYSLDGLIEKTIKEYKLCKTSVADCPNASKKWDKYFSTVGQGLYDPFLSDSFYSSTSSPLKDVTRSELMIRDYSERLYDGIYAKLLVEVMNIYGGENFNYFKFLENGTLDVTEDPNGTKLLAPGKVVVAVLMKMVNARMVNYYKFTKCKLDKRIAELKSSADTAAKK